MRRKGVTWSVSQHRPMEGDDAQVCRGTHRNAGRDADSRPAHDNDLAINPPGLDEACDALQIKAVEHGLRALVGLGHLEVLEHPPQTTQSRRLVIAWAKVILFLLLLLFGLVVGKVRVVVGLVLLLGSPGL